MTRILLVEDNEMNRDMLSRRLIRRGYQVTLAADGQAGLEAAALERPDIILMDMGLPVMDGWEATRRLRQSPQTSRIPIIALTAHALAGDREKTSRAGCDGYATKPVDLPKLIEMIEGLLRETR